LSASDHVSPDMLRKQLTIVASWTFSWQDEADCARFVVERKVDVEKLFTHRWKLDQAEEAYAARELEIAERTYKYYEQGVTSTGYDKRPGRVQRGPRPRPVSPRMVQLAVERISAMQRVARPE
jgi:hypothetical protein